MPITRRFSGVAERIGNNTADFTDKLAEGVRNFSCELWRRFPDQITQNKALATSFARGFMNNVCSDQELPDPPPEPLIGGQCDAVYRIRFQRGEYSVQDGSFQWALTGDLIFTSVSGVATLQICRTGANPQCFFPETDALPNGQSAQYEVRIGLNNGQEQILSISGFQPAMRLITFSSGSYFQREDGLPDDCGNSPTQYPPTSPTVNDYTTIININSEDNSTLSYPVTYNPTTYNFPLDFDLGGINVQVNLGGIDFNFSAISIDGVPVPLPSGESAPTPRPSDDGNRGFPGSEPPPNLIEDYVPKPPNPEDFDEDIQEDVTGVEETQDVGEVVWVLVEVTTYPTPIKNKIIIMNDSSDNTMFAGYLNWTILVNGQEYRLPDIPIRKERSAFPAPRNTQGYRIYALNGARLRVTKYVQKEETV